MPAPLFKVEVAFNNGPNDTSPTYTDISQYVRRYPPLTYSRGNTDETQQLQPGQMSFTVDNSDGRFTVGSSASTSAWGTVLKIRRPVRLSLWDGSAYQVAWTGTVDDWGAGWLGGTKGLSRVTCSDRVAAAGRIDLPYLINGEILAAGATSYYALDNPAGTVEFDPVRYAPTSGTDLQLSITDYGNTGTKGVTFGEPGPGIEGQTAFTFLTGSASIGYYMISGAAPGGTESSFTLSIFCKTSVLRAQGAAGAMNGGGGGPWIGVNSSGLAVGSIVSTTTGTVTGPFIADGNWHHLAATFNAGTVTLYVDGVSAGTAAYTSGGATLTNVIVAADHTENNLWDGSLAHLATWSTVQTATNVGYIASAALSTTVETTGQRWNRMCRIAGLSSTWYAADTTSGTQALTGTKGSTLASQLQAIAGDEQGYAYATTAGVLTLKARETRYNKSSTLTIAPQTANPELEFPSNDAYLRNTVEASNGSRIEFAQDTTSRTDFGIYRDSVTPNFPVGSAQALNLAQWLVYRYKTPTARARGLAINGTTKASSITATQLLALDVNSRVALSPLSGPVPSSSVQVFIDGLSGTVGETWEVDFNTSPTTGLDGLVLDTSTLDNAASILLY